MGVVRLLCITIAFAFLATVAALDCNSNGARVNGRCVCTSGFAGALCETQNPGACFASINTPQNLKDNWFPNLVQSTNAVPLGLTEDLRIKFENNVLSLNINGELVSQRTYTEINFINNLHPTTLVTDPRCALSGGNSSFWTQSNQVAELPQVDGNGNTKYAYRCGDLFTLAMPWDQHSACGFSANAAFEVVGPLYHQYEAIIKMNYDDVLDVFDPEHPPTGNLDEDSDKIRQTMLRHASVSYTIYVKFTKMVQVEVTNVVVFSQVNLTVVLTQFEYDPSTSAATMTFASIVRYPHIAVRNFTTIEIPHNAALSFGAGSGNPTGSWSVHPETDSSIRLGAKDVCDVTPADYNNPPKCLQYFTTKVYLGTGSCNFDGQYIFGTLVSTCRDDATYRSCPSEMQFVGLSLSNSGVCGAVTAEPQVTGELVAYPTAAMNTAPQNEYLVGNRAFFAVKVNTRNSFHLKWLDIFTISMDDTTPYDMNDRIPDVTNLTYVRPPHAQYFVKDARLQYNNFFTSTHTNSDASFDPAKYPNGPVDIQGWQDEVTVNGHLTDGAVVMGPNFNFRWDGGIFTPGINKKKVYNVVAKAQLTFEGNEAENRKREVKIVDFVYKPENAGMTTNLMCGLLAEETVAPAPASEAVTSSSINMVAIKAAVPVAGVALVVVAVAVIAAVVIVRRKKNTTAFRTMA